MGSYERRMISWLWEQVGGTLIREFPLLPEAAGENQIFLNAVVLPYTNRQVMPKGTRLWLEGQNVMVVQTKIRYLSMRIIAKTAFYAQLVQSLCNPRNVNPVILCAMKDQFLYRMLTANGRCKVIVCPQEICS